VLKYEKESSQLFKVLRNLWRNTKEGEPCSSKGPVDGINACDCSTQDHKYILRNCPKVFSFNIAWNNLGTNTASCVDILSILSLIPNVFDPRDIFGEFKDRKAEKIKYFFKGMICFWGAHYFCYFRNFNASASDCWNLYDDQRVIKVGCWDEVLDRCLKGHEKPILLLFEELISEDVQYIAHTRHHLNNLIGEQQWRQMYKVAEETDKELEALNAP
jgi:hypothetical protein